MFGFKKNNDDLDEFESEAPASPLPPPPTQTAPRPTPAPAPAPAPVKAATSAPRGTHIAADTQVHGHVRSGAGLTVAGEVNGNVHAEAMVVVEQSARVQGDVCGDDVIVRGRVEGQVAAKGKLTISATGLVLGDIVVRSLLIEDGGTLQGQCRMGATASNEQSSDGAEPPELPADDDEAIDEFMPELAASG